MERVLLFHPWTGTKNYFCKKGAKFTLIFTPGARSAATSGVIYDEGAAKGTGKGAGDAHVVKALVVGQSEGDVCLPKDNRTGGLDPTDGWAVRGRQLFCVERVAT
jgi:hypothetical protein